ncbi:MAG: hypothetical protein O7E52_08810 [Candidatus Poribacteria bacterium]|nr:hypothetical protein [Candidatus Poribacteria bacterium]
MMAKQLNICCSVASPNTFTQTLRLIASGKVQVEPLVTHVLPLESAEKAFEIQQEVPQSE